MIESVGKHVCISTLIYVLCHLTHNTQVGTTVVIILQVVKAKGTEGFSITVKEKATGSSLAYLSLCFLKHSSLICATLPPQIPIIYLLSFLNVREEN